MAAIAPAIAGFWARFKVARPAADDARFYEAFYFGDHQELADSLAGLVLGGRKRATAALLWAFEVEGKPLPRPGDLSVVTNWAGQPLCVIETLAVDVVPFDDVSAEFAATEGEGDGSLAHWQREHASYFARECARIGRVPDGSMPVVCERFAVVYAPAHAVRSPGAAASVVAPSLEHERAFVAMVADFEAHDAPNAEFYLPAKADFTAYVQGLQDEERGLHLREGWVPCTHRWLLGPDGAVVAVARLRHHIETPFLASNGGHIGYDVAPSHRGRGHGHAVLQAALAEARAIGLQRVMLYTGEGNAASRAVIERQGGELASIAYSAYWKEQLCRYWIELPRHPAASYDRA